MRLSRPVVMLAAAAAAALAVARRKQSQTDAELLWREATADASR